jgi:hypothetical protein
MNRYEVTWNETTSYYGVVFADSPEEAIAAIKDGDFSPQDVKSKWNEWDDHSFVATKKCRCGNEADKGDVCWQCDAVEDQRQIDNG